MQYFKALLGNTEQSRLQCEGAECKYMPCVNLHAYFCKAVSIRNIKCSVECTHRDILTSHARTHARARAHTHTHTHAHVSNNNHSNLNSKQLRQLVPLQVEISVKNRPTCALIGVSNVHQHWFGIHVCV
jgi:hypothetical protein